MPGQQYQFSIQVIIWAYDTGLHHNFERSQRTDVLRFRRQYLWKRQPPENVVSAVNVSGDGSRIIAHYPLHEDAAVLEAMTSKGFILWRKTVEAGFRLSHKGKYLYSGWNMLDGNDLIVMDADSGAVVWQRRMQMYWEQLLDEDNLVTVDQSGFIRLYEMESGKS